MKKNELVHLHSLFLLLKQHLEDGDGYGDEAFEEYESLGIAPQHVYRPKERHREAVQALAADVANEIAAKGKYRFEEEQPDAVNASG